MTSNVDFATNITQLIYAPSSVELISRAVLVIYFLVGFVGNTLNILLFTRANLLRTSTSAYLLCASVGNMFVIVFVIPFRLFADGFHLDATNISTVTCRIVSYVYFVCLAIPPFFNILACADRWAASSVQVNRRRFAHIQIAKRIIPFPILLCSLLYSYVLFIFVRDRTPPPPFCSVDNRYAVFVLSFYLITYTVIPPALMIGFSLGIMLNVYKKQLRIEPNIRAISHSASARESFPDQRRRGFSPMQLMLVCQAIVECLFTLPFSVINLVSMFVVNDENFLDLYSYIRLFIFFNYVSSFYIYTLSSKVYRTELRQLFISFFQRRPNQR